jgi:peptidoglycan hydrolase-like protein with peptidoglycan-binding domain
VTRAAAAVLVAAALLAGCGGARRVEAPAAPAEARPEAPDRPEEKGVPPAAGRPRVPASPEALLAEGAVMDIQEALADLGHLGEHRKGELDDATSAALRTFQAEVGLAETGFPDRETLSKLGVDPDAAYGRAGDEPRE